MKTIPVDRCPAEDGEVEYTLPGGDKVVVFECEDGIVSWKSKLEGIYTYELSAGETAADRVTVPPRGNE